MKITGVTESIVAVSEVITGRKIVGVPVLIPVRAVATPPAPANSYTLYQYQASSQWVFTNPVDHLPSVTVYMLSGVEADTDVDVTLDTITVTWANPHTGYLVIN